MFWERFSVSGVYGRSLNSMPRVPFRPAPVACATPWYPMSPNTPPFRYRLFESTFSDHPSRLSLFQSEQKITSLREQIDSSHAWPPQFVSAAIIGSLANNIAVDTS